VTSQAGLAEGNAGTAGTPNFDPKNAERSGGNKGDKGTKSPGPKKGMPSEDSSSGGNSSVLDARSSFSKKNFGGGTGNNTEASGGKAGRLSPNSPYARRTHGGGGNDAGDNNHVSKGGTLANGTPLARKNYGDGGESDTRGGGGGGGPSKIAGRPKVTSGGGPHQAGNNLKSKGTESNSVQH
jgi:hypothetical protein